MKAIVSINMSKMVYCNDIVVIEHGRRTRQQ